MSLNHPLHEAAESADAIIKRGGQVFQKFTCSSCGQRLAMSEPNTFYKTGECDVCGAITDIEATGCNYIAVFDRSAIENAKGGE